MLPWLGQTLIGTTDTDHEGDADHVQPVRRRTSTTCSTRSTRSSRTALDAGRPRRRLRGRAAADLHRRPAQVGRHLAQGRALRDLERDDHDHRRQAHDLAADGQADRRPDRRARRLGRHAAARTRSRSGWRSRPTTSSPRPEASREQLAGRYGHVAHDVLALRDRPSWRSRSSPGRPDLLAEVAYAARREQARTVGDVLLRRTRLGLTAARGAAGARRGAIERVAAVLGGRARAGTRRAARARRTRSARRRARRASCPPRRVRRNFRAASPVGARRSPSTWSRFATPSRSSCSPPLLVLVPAASAHAGWFPRAADRRPERRRRRRSATSTSPATAPARSPTCATTAASRTPSSRACSAAPGSAPERVDPTARRGDRGQGRGRRRQPDRGRLDRRRQRLRDRRRRAATRPAPFAGPPQLGGPGAESLDIDLGVNGAAYAVWQQGGDVRAARLQDATWTRVAAPLDIDPAREAGTGALRPRVAVSAEGYAVATWGERIGGRLDARLRRAGSPGMNLSAVPQDLTLPDGGSADSPDIDIEDDGSFAWVVFRQDIGGVSRTVARRLVGSQFEAAEVDRRRAAVRRTPRVDMSGARRAATRSRRPSAARRSSAPGSTTTTSQPGGAARQRRQRRADQARGRRHATAATSRSPGADRRRRQLGRARPLPRRRDADGAFGGELTVSRGDLGPVADPGVFIGGDRVGDFAVAMVQGTAGRAGADGGGLRPPAGRAVHRVLAEAYKRKTRPELRWRPGLDLWGAQTFRVYMDGVLIGQTTNDTLVPATPLTTGQAHAGRSRPSTAPGRPSRSRVRTLKIDSIAPTLKVTVVAASASAGQRAEDHGQGDRHAAAPGSTTSRSTTATSSATSQTRDHAPPLQARASSR